MPNWLWYALGIIGAIFVFLYIRSNQGQINPDMNQINITEGGSIFGGSASPFSTGTPGGGAIVAGYLAPSSRIPAIQPGQLGAFADMGLSKLSAIAFNNPPAGGAGAAIPRAVSVPGINDRVGIQIVDNMGGYTSWLPVEVGPKY
jgi:hypothetical protein